MIHKNSDKIGFWTSFVCLIHCLFLPLFTSLVPSFVEGTLEYILIGIAVVIGSISFVDNVIKHKYFLSLVLFLVGFLFIFVSKIIDIELINIFGLLILMVAHYTNYLKIKEVDGCHPHGCKH